MWDVVSARTTIILCYIHIDTPTRIITSPSVHRRALSPFTFPSEMGYIGYQNAKTIEIDNFTIVSVPVDHEKIFDDPGKVRL